MTETQKPRIELGAIAENVDHRKVRHEAETFRSQDYIANAIDTAFDLKCSQLARAFALDTALESLRLRSFVSVCVDGVLITAREKDAIYLLDGIPLYDRDLVAGAFASSGTANNLLIARVANGLPALRRAILDFLDSDAD